MGKYRSAQKAPSASTMHRTVNPYMRGIGCLLMLVVPVFSYFTGLELAKNGVGRQVLPASFYGYMTFPSALYNFSGTSFIVQKLSGIAYLPATLTMAFIIIIIVGGLLSIIFGYMYSVFAPSKYGPFDVPAPRIKTKKYKR